MWWGWGSKSKIFSHVALNAPPFIPRFILSQNSTLMIHSSIKGEESKRGTWSWPLAFTDGTSGKPLWQSPRPCHGLGVWLERFFTCRLQTFLVQIITLISRKKAANVWENRTSQFTPPTATLAWESLCFPHMPGWLCLFPCNTVNSSLLHSFGTLMWNYIHHFIQYFASFMRKLEHLWVTPHWACMLLWYF